MEVMSALLGIIERETELVRAGKVREAMRLEEQKNELSRRYMVAVENLKNAQKHLTQVAPECWRRCAAITKHSAPCCRSI